MTAEDWIEVARADEPVACHALCGPRGTEHQCAGLVIFRANICKLSRDPHALRLPADRTTVFATPQQFIDHHTED